MWRPVEQAGGLWPALRPLLILLLALVATAALKERLARGARYQARSTVAVVSGLPAALAASGAANAVPGNLAPHCVAIDLR